VAKYPSNQVIKGAAWVGVLCAVALFTGNNTSAPANIDQKIVQRTIAEYPILS
jgi:hypothetical protein